MASLKYLQNNKNLIIKPADKGGAIVIWPRDDYLREASKQLENNAHYQHITHNPFPNLITTIQKFIQDMVFSHLDSLTTPLTNFSYPLHPHELPHYICYQKYTKLTFQVD